MPTSVVVAASVTTHMGLMPELERVWISIDHNLFLWDYMEGYVPLHATDILLDGSFQGRLELLH